MAGQSKSEIYEKGLQLAESGQYQQALDCIKQYLNEAPDDGQAWNDIGAIMYCLGDIDGSIEYFEKARKLCNASEAGEVYWNLSEAYIDGGYPTLAASLFDEMEQYGILTADAINRVANIFLQQEYYGNAIEALLRSLRLTPNQEILHPMIEVIRTKRAKLSVFASEKTDQLNDAVDFFGKRFNLEVYEGTGLEEIRNRMQWSDIAWFEGCDQTVIDISGFPKVAETIIRLSNNDILNGNPEKVNWANIDKVIVAGGSFAMDAFTDKVNDIEKLTSVVTIARGIDTDQFKFVERTQGKRLAYAGDLTAASNPMLLLQCMQKLNYIDNDYRLHIAGEFTDKLVEQYFKYSVESMGLSNAIFFDGKQSNLNTWLRDKNYIVSTGICDSAMPTVLKAMSCGLKPIVHDFPGASEIIDAEFTFDIAENFCNMITTDSYQPQRYHDIAQSRSLTTEMKAINDVVVRFEKELIVKRAKADQQAQISIDNVQTKMQAQPQAVDFNTIQGPSPVSTAEPLNNSIVSEPVIEPAFTQPTVEPILEQPVVEPAIAQASKRTIEQVAAEALRASKTLEAMANTSPDSQQQTWNQGPIDAGQGQVSHSSLDAASQEDRIAKIASEFADIANASRDNAKTVEHDKVPFGG